jgi:hypothetical protein
MLKYNSLLIKRLNQQLSRTINSRDIYALSTLMSQQREVIADLRTMVDMSGQADMLKRLVVGTLVTDTTQNITDIYLQLRKLLADTTQPKQTQFALKHLDELLRQFGSGLQSAREKSYEKIDSLLLGTGVEEPKKKRR